MRKQRIRKILITLAIIVAVIALVIGVALVVNSVVQEKKGQEIDKIVISGMPKKQEYYLGEQFEPNGLRVQVFTKDMKNTYFVDFTQLTISGFDSSAINESVEITVSYKGHSATFTIKVKDHEPQPPHLVSIEVKDLKTTYSLEKWNKNGPDYNGAYLLCTYSDGTTENVWIQSTWATQREIMDAPGKTYVTIEYMGKSIQVEFTITN